MEGEKLFLCLIAAIALIFSAFNGVRLARLQHRTACVEGKIVSIMMPNPERVRFRNSKWAQVAYRVDGHTYTSQNRVQVPMAARVGTPVTVRYDRKHPDRLYSFSAQRVLAGMCIAAVCAAVMFYLE